MKHNILAAPALKVSVTISSHNTLMCGRLAGSRPSADTEDTEAQLGTQTETRSSYPGGMLLHLVLVAVRTTGMATPKAVLAELVVVALLASVPEAHHALTPAVGALHGMEDWPEAEDTGVRRAAETRWDKREKRLFSLGE